MILGVPPLDRMWPRTLDMSVDECRLMLRKLELETYANVISAFRAHGILDERRINCLCELRSILNIDQDRHRSELRRATNDEHLTTIADKLFGDDAIIQWTREGKRGAPLLYRSKPYTSITVTANAAADWARRMNRRLPDPSTVKRRPEEPPLPLKSNLILTDPSRPISLPRPISVLPQLFPEISHTHRVPCHPSVATPTSSTVTSTPRAGKSRREASSQRKPTKHNRLLLEQTKHSGKGVPTASKSSRGGPTTILPIVHSRVSSASSPTEPPPPPSKRSRVITTEKSPTTTINNNNGNSSGSRKRASHNIIVPPPFAGEYDCAAPSPSAQLRHDLLPQIAKSKKDICSNLSKMQQIGVAIKVADGVRKRPKQKTINCIQIGDHRRESLDRDTVSEDGQELDYGVGSILYNHLQGKNTTTTATTTKSKSNEKQNNLIGVAANGTVEHSHTTTSRVNNGISVSLDVDDDEGTMEATETELDEVIVSFEDDNEEAVDDGEGIEVRGDLKSVQERLLGIPEDSKSAGVVLLPSRYEKVSTRVAVVELDESLTDDLIETSDDKIIFDMNESCEVIEEDCGVILHEDDIEDEEDYVTMEDEEGDVGNGDLYDENHREFTNGTDFEYLLDTAGANGSQILVEEVDANGYSQVKKANLMELMVAPTKDVSISRIAGDEAESSSSSVVT